MPGRDPQGIKRELDGRFAEDADRRDEIDLSVAVFDYDSNDGSLVAKQGDQYSADLIPTPEEMGKVSSSDLDEVVYGGAFKAVAARLFPQRFSSLPVERTEEAFYDENDQMCGDYSMGASCSARRTWRNEDGTYTTAERVYFVEAYGDDGQMEYQALEDLEDGISLTEKQLGEARHSVDVFESEGDDDEAGDWQRMVENLETDLDDYQSRRENVEFSLNCMTLWARHTDRDDPGGSEVYGDVTYDANGDGPDYTRTTYSDLGSANEAVKKFGQNEDFSDLFPENLDNR